MTFAAETVPQLLQRQSQELMDAVTNGTPEVWQRYLDENATVTAEELMDFVKERIADYKRVREVEFIDKVPRTASGKILRRELAEKEKAASASR